MQAEEFAGEYNLFEDTVAQHWEIPEFRTLLLALHDRLGEKAVRIIRTLGAHGPGDLDRLILGEDADQDGTPVSWMMSWDVDLLPLAVRAGADVNKSHKRIGGSYTDRDTMIVVAVEAKRADLVNELLHLGASPDADPGLPFYSPLVAAVCGKDRSMVELLLDRGADANKCPGVLSAALAGSTDFSMFHLLLNHVRDPSNVDTSSLCFLDQASLEMFLDNTTYSLNAPREQKDNLLYRYAAAAYLLPGRYAPTLQLLLDRGADVELAGEYKDRIIQDFL